MINTAISKIVDAKKGKYYAILFIQTYKLSAVRDV
jgi:hypothetical protein